MRIERLTIKNFRAIQDITIDLHPKVTVLVGGNNAGKTSVLDALAAVLTFRGPTPFTELDFRSVDAAISAAQVPSITVELALAPTSGSQFDPAELGSHTPQVANTGERFILRLETAWNPDPTVAGLETTLAELRIDGQPLRNLNRFPFAEELPLHAFGADRDLRRGLGSRWSNWGRILSESRPQDFVRQVTMSRLRSASNFLIRHTSGLKTVREALQSAGRVTGIGTMGVTLSAAPEDVDELLRRIAIELRLPGAGRAFGADRHGLGTQGAILFAVYRLHAQQLCSVGQFVSPVMTIEEPEAHLHPTAQRALASVLEQLPGQVIATSHSPELLRCGIRPIVLQNRAGITRATTGAWSNNFESYGRALFARCIVLTEGLESLALDVCARATGFSLHERGVEVIDARGQGSIVKLWKVFGPSGFNLPIACLADADVQQHLLQFLQVLTGIGAIATVPTGAAVYRVLRENGYFVPREGMNLEEALVDHCSGEVDRVLASITGETFQDWRRSSSSDLLPSNRCNRANALRGGTKEQLVHKRSTVADLTHFEARVHRLATDKSVIPQVLIQLTNDGTERRLLPIGLRQAMRYIDNSTRGQ